MNSGLSSGSIKIGDFAGIPVKVHWTFGFLILFILYFVINNDLSAGDAFWFFTYVMILFAFVVMHEFGHALTARRYGVKTRDVVISPIGGVARLENMPKEPRHELVIALAGPAVNVVLALFFGVVQWIGFGDLLPRGKQINLVDAPQDYIGYLLLINLALIIFNMIPAFPMDGGRVLRSLLTMWTSDRLKATRIASVVGQVFAVFFIVTGVFTDYNFMLIFIGIFVFVMARSEYRQIAAEYRMLNTSVEQVAYREFTRVYRDDEMSKLFELEEESSFLVFNKDRDIVGAIPSIFIDDCRQRNAGHEPVSRYIQSSFGYLTADMNMMTAFHALNNYGWFVAAVLDNENELIGVIDRKMISDFIGI